ncbi:CHAT domain-containing protein [Streptomyces sp. NPDC048350]|uniref:CHAT domain-containing protein n=1 Tax=Streptomyces sp. NPDC048350 TaxID=3365538 RepID=UPI003719AA4A
MELARQWVDLVETVRSKPGFSSFQRPLKASELRAAALHGPVVVVNVSERRGDAVVAGPHEIVALPLAVKSEDIRAVALTYVQAIEHHQGCLAALEGAATTAHAKPTAQNFRAYQQATSALIDAETAMERQLTSTLHWLWDTIARPVFDACGLAQPISDGQPWPRLWWCPTGLLSLLPVHAAGRHTEAGQSAMDRAVVSYTPSLRALIESRSWERSPAEAAVVHIAMPETPGQSDLPHVEREEQLLKALFGADCTTLMGSDADRTTVRRELYRHRFAHFSCHATAHSTRPALGGMLLSDGLLSVGEIAADHRHREFAFLSACKTALGGLLLPDESMAMSSALHYTGYRHVIGTIWSVRDAVAADVAEGVYQHMRDGGVVHSARAPTALHQVVRRLRDASPDRPSHWMPFTHTGP